MRNVDLLFLVGCPRSGTTWLQALLGEHPSIVTSPETHVFARMLRTLDSRWAAHGEDDSGLHAVMSREDLNRHLKSLSDRVFRRILDARPQASVLLEKSPPHALDWPLIRRLYPDARFLHIVRDPRAVAASLIHAGKGWGASWAPSGAVTAGAEWCRYMEHARALAASGAPFREVRYEDLRAAPVEVLRETLEWVGVASDPEICAQAVEACTLRNVEKRAPTKYVARRGATDGWRTELAPRQIAAVEWIAAPLMEAFGYARTTSSRPLAVELPALVESLRSVLLRSLDACRDRI